MTEALGAIIKRRRDAMGLTQRELAERIGISHTYVFNLESGRNDIPGPRVMARLAEAIGVPEDRLLRAVGYLQHAARQTDQFMLPDDVSGAAIRELLVQRLGGDNDAARKLLYEALGGTIQD